MENKQEKLPNLRIIIAGPTKSGKSTLINIIKRCLENDYTFRAFFAGANVDVLEYDTTLEKYVTEKSYSKASINKDKENIEEKNE
jgi:ABC-type lipoprotein export system ATPase subunit